MGEDNNSDIIHKMIFETLTDGEVLKFRCAIDARSSFFRIKINGSTVDIPFNFGMIPSLESIASGTTLIIDRFNDELLLDALGGLLDCYISSMELSRVNGSVLVSLNCLRSVNEEAA